MNLKPYFEELKNKYLSDKNLSSIALFPLFFSWYPIFVLNFDKENIRKVCIRSMILTVSFFFFLLVGSFLTFIPNYGSILANLSHLLGIIIYIAISGILIYSNTLEKTMDIRILEKYVDSINQYLMS